MSGGLRHEDDDDKFVIIPRPTIRDARLSFRARGLLAFILDLPKGWDVNAAFLVKQGKEGREAVYAALSELRAAGYYRVEKRRADGGRWVTGTAVSKTARPSWAAEYAEQEAARKAKREEQLPVYEPTADTEGEGLDTATDVRVSVHREPEGREADSREAVGLKEERGRRSDKETPLPTGGAPADDDDPQLPLVDAPAQPAPTRPRRDRHKLPDDWTASPELLAKARAKAPSVDVAAEVEKFIGYHRSTGDRKIDWDLAFLTTWIGRATERRGTSRRGPYRNPQTPHQPAGPGHHASGVGVLGTTHRRNDR
jgi:hypothetical protein